MTQSDIISLVSQLETKEDLLALLNKLKFEELGGRSFSFNIRQLNYYANPNHTKGRYRSFEVPKKKKGAMRTISAPSNGLKMLLRYVNIILQALYRPSENTMGFVRGRSVKDNASRHNHQNYILNLDLVDFFPSISQARVWKRLQCPQSAQADSGHHSRSDSCEGNDHRRVGQREHPLRTSPRSTNLTGPDQHHL